MTREPSESWRFRKLLEFSKLTKRVCLALARVEIGIDWAVSVIELYLDWLSEFVGGLSNEFFVCQRF